MSKKQNTVTAEQIDAMLKRATFINFTTHDKCTIVSAKLENGFVITETSACVDPSNYDAALGYKICMDRIKDKLWELEGYCLQKQLYEGK